MSFIALAMRAFLFSETSKTHGKLVQNRKLIMGEIMPKIIQAWSNDNNMTTSS